uniref:Uncharacterized protein n=1 Tax=Romanomermis culicivorax TaxID=13658 RepID=A0A915I241_ROMCU
MAAQTSVQTRSLSANKSTNNSAASSKAILALSLRLAQIKNILTRFRHIFRASSAKFISPRTIAKKFIPVGSKFNIKPNNKISNISHPPTIVITVPAGKNDTTKIAKKFRPLSPDGESLREKISAKMHLTMKIERIIQERNLTTFIQKYLLQRFIFQCFRI